MDARIVGRVLIILSVVLNPAATAGGEGIEDAIQATAYLEIDRVFSGRLVMTSGTAFFVHPKGYLLTNAHVVSNKIESPDGREVYAKVLKLRAFADSGNPGEREFKAVVVVTDRESDLALLKVDYSPPRWLDLARGRVPAVTDQVWVVGYPLGDLLGMYDKRTDQVSRPLVSVNGGRVTSLRKDSASVLKVIQMDAAVNPGNSGGPLVDDRGAPLGIVTAKVGGAAGLGFAIPAHEIDSFFERRAFVTRFVPPVVYHGMPPLRISVTPVFSEVGGLGGTITIDGGNTTPLTRSLSSAGNQLTASFPLLDQHADAANGGFLRARVTVSREDGAEAMHRVFRLRGSGGVAEQTSSATVAPADDETSVQRATTGGGALGGGKLGGVDVEKSKDSKPTREVPSFVIDNQLMYERDGFIYANWRYEKIPDQEDRNAALEYEKITAAIYRKLDKMKKLRNSDPHVDWDQNSTYKRHRTDLDQLRSQARRQAEVLRTRRVCRCGLVWVMCENAPCSEPERPWEND